MVQEEEILAQLDRILSSPVFANAARSKEFLKYCVNCGLHGEHSHLKETTIAVEVFLREASYDPKSDPIVRVHARRVREKLGLYYRTAGRLDPIAIELPKGSYVPQFLRLSEGEANLATETAEAPLLTAEPEPPELPAKPISEPPADSPRKAWAPSFLSPVLLILLLSLVAFAVWRLRERSSGTTALRSLEPISYLPPDVRDAAWSPDGKTVAFVQVDAVDHVPFIAILSPSFPQSPQRLTHGGMPEYRPVWSPDNRQIAFIRMLDDVHFAIIRHDLDSGSELVSRPFVSYFPMSVDHPTLDWSPDGHSLLTTEQVSPGTPMRLVLMNLQDGTRRYLTSPPIGSSGDIEAKFSPDGASVAFRRGGLGDLYVVGIAGERNGNATRLTFDNRGVRGIAFVDGGKSILFSTDHSANETYSIYKIPVSGGTGVALTPDGFAAMNPVSVREGAFTFRHIEAGTQMVEIVRDATTETPLLPSSKIDESAAYGPDGNTIAFLSTRSGFEELWLQRRGSSVPERLTQLNGQGFLFGPHWSPDGKSITFSFRRNGATNVMVYDVPAGRLRTITDTTSRDFNPVFSYDSRYVFFSSNGDGTSRIWRMDVEGKQPPEPLFTEAVSNFAPSSDGQWLYYLDNRQPLTLFRRNLLDGTTQNVYHTDARPALVNSLVVTEEGIYLAVAHINEQQIRIERIDPVSFQAKTAWLISGYADTPIVGTQSFDVSSDGSRLLTTRLLRHSSAYFLAEESKR